MIRHPLTTTLESQEGQVSEEEIEYYRFNGGIDIRDRLIYSHMKSVCGIAKRFANRKMQKQYVIEYEELSSVGLTWLTQVVIWAGPHLDKEGEPQESRLNDNRIASYIGSTVTRRIRDFIARNRTVYVPPRTFRDKHSRGIKDPNIDLACRFVKSTCLDRFSFKEEIPDEPLAKPEEPSIELYEALDLAILTETERRVVDLRSEGYLSKDIATILGVSNGKISQIMAPIEERFLRLYA